MALPLLALAAGPAGAQPGYDALVQEGRAALQAGDDARALEDGSQAIRQSPARWEAYALAGGALINLKRYEEAADQLSDALQRAPTDKQDAIRTLRRSALAALAGTAAPSAPPLASAHVEPQTTQAEIVLWKTIEHSTDPAEFKAYLSQYPNGVFAGLAQERLASIDQDTRLQPFVQAKRLMVAGDYAGAEGAFTGFLRQFPQDQNAPEAHYWLGKTLSVRGANMEAAAAYVAALRGWPKSAWAPDAVVELADALVALGKRPDACVSLAELASRYPETSGRVAERAAAIRRKAKCS